MATPYRPYSVHERYNHEQEKSRLTESSSSRRFRSISFSSQMATFLGLSFKSHEMCLIKKGIKMSWCGPLSSLQLILQGKKIQVTLFMKKHGVVRAEVGRCVVHRSKEVEEGEGKGFRPWSPYEGRTDQ